MHYPGNLKLIRLRPSSRLPSPATEGSASYDLYADLDAPEVILPGQTVTIPTGLSMQIAPGFAGFIFARSGLGVRHGIVPANCVGVIDSDYRGEVLVALYNHAEQPFTVRPGDRMAQLVLLPVALPQIEECRTLEESVRGSGGFGSTGR